MKKIVKKLENKLKFLHYILCRIRIIKKVGIGLLLFNIICHYIFRINKSKQIIHFTSRIIAPKSFVFHNDITTITSFMASGGCYFQALNGIRVGKNFLFAPGVKIISSNHGKIDKSIIEEKDPIVIGDNVWIGANAIILPGVEIGNYCVVGAGAVVTKSFKNDNLIIAGNPARVIGNTQHNIQE
jgi:acetyltransferase-like isoleucine patch superfamily enzyme